MIVSARARAVAAWMAVAALWVWAAVVVLLERSSLLDDAFITLHLATNVLDTGTARFSPSSSSTALLASSPLRLLILVATQLPGAVFGGPERTELGARVAFLVSGPLTAAVFLPFFVEHRRAWLLGLGVSALLAVAYDSVTQMEAAIVFWVCFTFYHRFDDLSARPGLCASLVGVAALARIEYGIALAAPCVVLACAPASVRIAWPRVRHFMLVALGIGVAWCALAGLLSVWPVPASWLSKVRTAERQMFGPSFGEVLPEFLQSGLFGARSGAAPPALGAVVLAALVLSVVVLRKERAFWVSAFAVQVIPLVILFRAPGNYIWYFESYVAGVAGLFLALFQRVPASLSVWWKLPSAAAIAALSLPRVGFDPPYPWDFHDPESRAHSYLSLAAAHRGGGVFEYTSSEPPAHIRVCEIGIIGYFSGPTVWLADVCGLAQPGELPPKGFSVLAALYPRSSLLTVEQDYARIARSTGRPLQPRPIYAIGSGWEALRAARRDCVRVVVPPRLCLAF